MTEPAYDQLRAHATSIFACGHDSVHGPGHWRNVEDSFLLIASAAGADVVVGRLFAILHDCCRVDDDSDLDHGPRAAKLIRSLPGTMHHLDPARLNLLVLVVQHHTDGEISNDPTVGACWDADRLDLGRVGIIPSPAYMSTQAGREIATLGSKHLYREKNKLANP